MRFGATWEGNQTWLITAAGATFAAWPLVYAVSFSGMYTAMLLVLFALFFRPVGIDYRSKVADPRWRAMWDWGLFAGGFVPPLVFGIAFGNLLQGLPFHFDDTMRSFYTGSFLALFNPFALLAGVISLAMLVLHGAIYLQLRTTGDRGTAGSARRVDLRRRAHRDLCAGRLDDRGIDRGLPDHRDAVRQRRLDAAGENGRQRAGRMARQLREVSVGECGADWRVRRDAAAMFLSRRGRPAIALACSALAVASVILTAGFAMFPFIVPSSSSPSSSLTVWDAVSSYKTLSIMFWVALFFVPVIVFYTGWVYRVLRGKITTGLIESESKTFY
jgi:cytochrome d ubiquinol oxidase subunit II